MFMASLARAVPPGPLPVRARMKGRFKTPPEQAGGGVPSSPPISQTCAGHGTLTKVGQIRFQWRPCSETANRDHLGARREEAEITLVTPTLDEVHAISSGVQLDDTRSLELIQIVGGSGELEAVSGSLIAIITLDSTGSEMSIRGWGWMIR